MTQTPIAGTMLDGGNAMRLDNSYLLVRSRAPLSAEDGWRRYTDDHLVLLDHLHVAFLAVQASRVRGSSAI